MPIQPNPHTQLALIGSGITYSLSRELHMWSGERLGIKNVNYQICDVGERDFNQLASYLQNHQITAFNITTPYKTRIKKVLPVAESSHDPRGGSDPTEQIDPMVSLPELDLPPACNCVIRSSGGGYNFYNTDGIGLISAMERSSLKVSPPRWVFLGFGGAVIGVIQCLLAREVPPEEIHVLWRQVSQKRRYTLPVYKSSTSSPFRSSSVPITLHPFTPASLGDVLSGESRACHHRDTYLVQGTPLPHMGHDLSSFAEVCLRSLRNKQGGERPLVGLCEMTYNAPSALLEALRGTIEVVVDGLELLVHQGIRCQGLWWHCAANPGEAYHYLRGITKT